MCVSIPSLVVAIDDIWATVETMGTQRRVSTQMLLEPVAPGDYVTVMAGAYATEKLDPALAAESLAYFAEFVDTVQS